MQPIARRKSWRHTFAPKRARKNVARRKTWRHIFAPKRAPKNVASRKTWRHILASKFREKLKPPDQFFQTFCSKFRCENASKCATSGDTFSPSKMTKNVAPRGQTGDTFSLSKTTKICGRPSQIFMQKVVARSGKRWRTYWPHTARSAENQECLDSNHMRVSWHI